MQVLAKKMASITKIVSPVKVFMCSRSVLSMRRRPSQAIQHLTSSHFATSSHLRGSQFYLDVDVEQRLMKEQEQFPYAIHELDFRTCSDYYQYLASQGQNKPIAGLRFKAAYVDTDPFANKKTTVLALHGCPGSHLDFKDLIGFLAKREIRVIALNFPGFGWTPTDKDKEFRHTEFEKATYIRDFLDALQIPKVDLIVGHSASVYPILVACALYKKANSIALINPGNLQRNHQLPPQFITTMMNFMYRNSVFRHFGLALLKSALTAIEFGNKNVHHMSIALETLSSVNFDVCRQNVLKLAADNFHVALIYSRNDRAVPLSSFEEYVKLFAADPQQVNCYDINGTKNLSGAETGNNFEGHCFDSGGHFVMKKYPDTVNSIVYNFLRKTKPSLPALSV